MSFVDNTVGGKMWNEQINWPDELQGGELLRSLLCFGIYRNRNLLTGYSALDKIWVFLYGFIVTLLKNALMALTIVVNQLLLNCIK